ncbi:MAG: MerR family transcriptional regulator [Blastocatellia bacterium AA13]|nr:MAG: MerR family transcriptional regulator [Blastocatellia bacterium AA13]
MARAAKKPKKYTISVVAEQYAIHPQTLRMYEREGLITPSRSPKGTRYYTEENIERLEVILSLTRDLGVNIAGIEIILNMLEKMKQMQRDFESFVEYVRGTVSSEFTGKDAAQKSALVPRRGISAILNQASQRKSF